MRGDLLDNEGTFSYLTPAQRVPHHPLRPIRQLVNDVLRDMWPVFERMYSRTGRPSIPPERVIRALVLMMLYSIRSERQLMEQLDFNILLRWFFGLGLDDRIWDATVFTKNRRRLLEGEVDVKFFEGILVRARQKGLLSEDHFTVDGTLIEAWAGQKSFRKKDRPTPPSDDPGNPTVTFRGEKRTNDTHEPKTDPQPRLLWRKAKGHEATLCFMGHALVEDRNGLAIAAKASIASGQDEREVAVELIRAKSRPDGRRITLSRRKVARKRLPPAATF